MEVGNWSKAMINWNDALAEQVHKLIPEGHTEAIIGTVNLSGAQIIIGVKVNQSGTLELQGHFEHKWTGENIAEAQLLWSR